MSQRNHVKLHEQAVSLCGKISIMADLQVNEKDHKSSSRREDDESAVLAEEGKEIQNLETTGVEFLASNVMWKAI